MNAGALTSDRNQKAKTKIKKKLGQKVTVTAKTTRNTKNADRFEALHILRSIAALTARNKTGTRAADENAPRVGRDGSKKYGYVRRRLVYSRERKVFILFLRNTVALAGHRLKC